MKTTVRHFKKIIKLHSWKTHSILGRRPLPYKRHHLGHTLASTSVRQSWSISQSHYNCNIFPAQLQGQAVEELRYY